MRLIAPLLLLLVLAVLPLPSMSQDKIGVVLMHGKNPGNPQGPEFQIIRKKFDSEGLLAVTPDMPWSARRYIDGDWTKAMQEIGGHIAKLKADGATKMFLVGHSIGAAAALSYAALHGGVDGVVMVAPGHAPAIYYSLPYGPNAAVKASVDEARAMVAAGKGDTRKDFKDNNQMRPLTPRVTAAAYLSYFDPEGSADMGVAATKISPEIPVLVLIGADDILSGTVKGYFVDKLPTSADTAFHIIAGDHMTVTTPASAMAVEWMKALAAKK